MTRARAPALLRSGSKLPHLVPPCHATAREQATGRARRRGNGCGYVGYFTENCALLLEAYIKSKLKETMHASEEFYSGREKEEELKKKEAEEGEGKEKEKGEKGERRGRCVPLGDLRAACPSSFTAQLSSPSQGYSLTSSSTSHLGGKCPPPTGFSVFQALLSPVPLPWALLTALWLPPVLLGSLSCLPMSFPMQHCQLKMLTAPTLRGLPSRAQRKLQESENLRTPSFKSTFSPLTGGPRPTQGSFWLPHVEAPNPSPWPSLIHLAWGTVRGQCGETATDLGHLPVLPTER